MRARPPRTQVRHGMASCAAYGCTRTECVEARRRANRRADKARRRGIAAEVDAGPATHRVQQLLRAGMSITDIADRTGVSLSPIRALVRGQRTFINRTTHDAILGLPLPSRTVPAHPGFVDATGATRRVRALSALGFPLPYLAGRLDVSVQNVGLIRRGIPARVRIAVHQAITDLYDEMWDQDPTAHGVRRDRCTALQNHARRQGWPMPADLDDDHIDWADRRGMAA